MNGKIPETLIIGEIKQDYIITAENRALNNRPSGSSVFSASGAAMWGIETTILATVDKKFPKELLKDIENRGIHIDEVSFSSQSLEHRQFSYYKSPKLVIHNDPAKYYLNSELPFPKELLGLIHSFNLTPHSIYQEMQLPNSLSSIKAAHLCPLPYDDHIRIPFILREKGIPIVTLKPGFHYLKNMSLNALPPLISNLTAFIPNKKDLYILYPLLRFDVWAILGQFDKKGCDFIVVPGVGEDTYLFDTKTKRKYIIPPYPVRVKNTIGVEDSFCGGFIAGYQKSYDPIEAALEGVISASFAMEGYTGLYTLDTLKPLMFARKELLREEVRLV